MARPRLSAALVLRRDLEDRRVFLARRAHRMRFFGGVFAFPGGTVCAADRQLGERVEVGDALRSTLWSALLREMIEELGLDLRDGAPESGRVGLALRQRLLDDAGHWPTCCSTDDLRRAPEPALRLVTPDFYPLRFDTSFFLATLGDRAHPKLDPRELDAGEFDLPEAWIERWEEGEILIAPPVVLMLRALATCAEGGERAALADLQEEIEGATPQRISVEPDVRLLPLRTPTLPPALHTNTYLVGTDPAYVVDPATPHASERRRLMDALAQAEAEGVRPVAILLTHEHPDHTGAARFLREERGWPVWAHRVAAERLSGRLRVDRALEDGERLAVGLHRAGGGHLRCVHTPGHAPGHLVFFLEETGGLLAGDMVSTLSSILVHPDDGCMRDYLDSLSRLESLGPRVVYPAHGPADTRGNALLLEQIAHRAQRESEVLAAIADGRTRIPQIVATVYPDLPATMVPHAASSVESILIELERQQRVRWQGEELRLL